MKRDHIAALDVGGTNIRLGLFSPGLKLLWMGKRPVEGPRTGEAIAAFIAGWIKDVEKELGVRVGAIGAGIPGIVNGREGIVYSSPHYPAWKKAPLAALIRKKTGARVRIDNDANLIALGEMAHGAGQKLNSFVMITLGTGIGGGLILDGRLHSGDTGFAGEIGHMVIERDGPPCACGSRGCLETYVSHTALKRLIRSQVENGDLNEDILGHPESQWGHVARSRAISGDLSYRAMFESMGSALGIGLMSLANILGVFNFVIGGGLSSILPLMRGAIRREIGCRGYRKTASLIRIHRARLGDKAGLMGSLNLVKSL